MRGLLFTNLLLIAGKSRFDRSSVGKS